MERYLVELDEHQLERLRGMVRDAIESANGRYCCKSLRGDAVEYKFETNESGRVNF